MSSGQLAYYILYYVLLRSKYVTWCTFYAFEWSIILYPCVFIYDFVMFTLPCVVTKHTNSTPKGRVDLCTTVLYTDNITYLDCDSPANINRMTHTVDRDLFEFWDLNKTNSQIQYTSFYKCYRHF